MTIPVGEGVKRARLGTGRKKLNCDGVATKGSVQSTVKFGASVVFQSCPNLKQKAASLYSNRHWMWTRHGSST